MPLKVAIVCAFNLCTALRKNKEFTRRKNFNSTEHCIRCGEGEDVVGVHTLLSGVVQVCHELLVGEEEEKEEEQGRQKEKEVKREDQSEETAHVNMDMEMRRMART